MIGFLVTLALVLLSGDLWLGIRSARHTKLIETYECGYLPEKPCEADFVGDGQLTRIEVNLQDDVPIELPPKFSGGTRALVLNTFFLDNSLRTHLGVRNEAGRARLIIYDGIKAREQNNPRNVVYAWNGSEFFEIQPEQIDKEILTAMAARDDTGTFNLWVLYWTLMWPVRLVYVLLFAVSAFVYFKKRRSARMSLANV